MRTITKENPSPVVPPPPASILKDLAERCLAIDEPNMWVSPSEQDWKGNILIPSHWIFHDFKNGPLKFNLLAVEIGIALGWGRLSEDEARNRLLDELRDFLVERKHDHEYINVILSINSFRGKPDRHAELVEICNVCDALADYLRHLAGLQQTLLSPQEQIPTDTSALLCRQLELKVKELEDSVSAGEKRLAASKKAAKKATREAFLEGERSAAIRIGAAAVHKNKATAKKLKASKEQVEEPEQSQAANIFKKNGDIWEIVNQGHTYPPLKDRIGLTYMHKVIQGEEFKEPLDLAYAVNEPPDHPTLKHEEDQLRENDLGILSSYDPLQRADNESRRRSQMDFKNRLMELSQERRQAKDNQDFTRIQQINEEFETLEKESRKITASRKKAKRNFHNEKAQKAISIAIHRAIDAIEEVEKDRGGTFSKHLRDYLTPVKFPYSYTEKGGTGTPRTWQT